MNILFLFSIVVLIVSVFGLSNWMHFKILSSISRAIKQGRLNKTTSPPMQLQRKRCNGKKA